MRAAPTVNDHGAVFGALTRALDRTKRAFTEPGLAVEEEVTVSTRRVALTALSRSDACVRAPVVPAAV